jgi:competence protein ComEA
MKTLYVLLLAAAALRAADPQEAKLLPEGPGKDAVAKACLDCHGAANFRMARKDADEWAESVQDMVDRGATATAAEADTIVAYLVKNFGKGAKVQMNTAPLEEIKKVLGFTVPEANAIVAWREQNGPYKDWRDVLKAPGIDAAKVESKKDAMAF